MRYFNVLRLAFIAILCGIVRPESSSAQVRIPFTQRTSAFTPTQSIYSINGDFVMIGNTNMTLQFYTDFDINSNNVMIAVDSDNDPTTSNSSSSNLAFSNENLANPSCSRVLFAGLYWTARTDGTPTELQKRTVKLRGPGQSSYTTYVASPNNIRYPGDNEMYVGFTEVTTQVQQQGQGSYSVADMAISQGDGGPTGFYGGWGMVVVYENSKMNKRDITVFDGYAYVEGGLAQWELPVSGFTTALNGAVNTKIGLMAGEGDVGIAGDKFEIQKLNTPDFNLLNHGGNQPDNFFNSSIFTGNNFRNPQLLNNTGMDISMFNIPNPSNSVIGNGQTATTFRYSSTQDTYIIYAICMAVDAYEPVVEGFLSTLNVNDIPTTSSNITVLPGDRIQYKVQVRNKGNEPINNARLEVPLPYAAIRYVGSSVNVYAPFSTSNLPYVDATIGANGTLIWNLGTLPLPSDPNTLLAEIIFTLKVSEDCELFRNFNCSAPSVQVDGTISGIGANTGFTLDRQPFYVGYSQLDGCTTEPLTGPFNININSVEWVASNCPAGDNIRDFVFCNRTAPIPVTDVIGFYPVGTRFFNSTQTTEYSISNPFPNQPGPVSYLAALPGTSCLLSFTIGINNISSVPQVSADLIKYCQNANSVALVATPSNPSYQLYFYSPGSSAAQPLLNPSTITSGNFIYQVAEGPSATCISTARASIPVQIDPAPIVTATPNEITCFGGTGSVNLSASGGTGTLQFSSSNPPTQSLSAGSYSYLVTDAIGCTGSATAVINPAPAQPEQPATECYQTATWDVVSCSWIISGTPAPVINTVASSCTSYVWPVNGQTYSSSGTYTFYQNCQDYSLTLTITPTVNTSQTESACGSYTWPVNGQTYTQSGTYTSSSTNSSGCTTLATLNLTITPVSTITTSASACGSYTWPVNGQTYTLGGTYSFTTGCVTEVLNLSINRPSSAASGIAIPALPVQSGQNFTLSVAGGNLGTAAVWKWYKGSCGGSAIGTGTSITVSQTVNTTYFVRAEGTCNTTACASVTISIGAACGDGRFAEQVISFNQRKAINGSAVLASRSQINKALCAPQNNNTENFVTLGFGGDITLKFGKAIRNGAGNDIRVYETTWGNLSCAVYPERARIFASQDGCRFVYLGEICQDGTVDLGPLEWAQFVRIVDVSSATAVYSGSGIADGYDVDAVEGLNGFATNPVVDPYAGGATEVVSYLPGKCRGGAAIPVVRTDKNKALGIPQGTDVVNFVSLGFGGSITLRFKYAIQNNPANLDLQVVETSYGNPSCTAYPEKANFEGSLDGINWTSLGQLCLDGKLEMGSLSYLHFLRITDASDKTKFGSTADGFDVDGVVAINQCTPGNGRVAMEITDDINTADEVDFTSNLELYPNPAGNTATFSFSLQSESEYGLKIINSMGQVVYSEDGKGSEGSNSLELNLEKFSNGLYIVQLVQNGNRQQISLIKR